MPLTVQHVLTATTPDNTQYEIRPSHWNSGHSVSFSAGADEVIKWASAGASSISSGTLVFSNSNGVSFGMNGGTVTASHNGLTTAAGSNHSHGFSAAGGSSAFQTLVFADSNGVSFSNSNGSLVATVATNYAASNHSHGNPTLVLSNLSGTTASNSAGFTLSLSAAAGGGGADGGVGLSAGANSISAGTVVLSNSNGVSFGLNGSTITASHNGLTTAALSNHSHGFSAGGGSSAFQTLSFSNGNGVTFTNTNGQVGASVNTSYRASNDAIGLNTALTANGVSVTANSSGLSLNFPAFLTTAALSNHSHGNPTLNLTNLSGTTGSNSAGFTLSLSANAPGAATLTVSAVGNTTVNSSGTWANALSLRAYGILSAGTSNGSLLLSTPDPVDFTQLSVGNSNLGNTAGDTGVFTGRVVFVGSNNITLSGSSNGGSATLSIIGAAGGGGSVNLSAGTTSNNLTNFVLSNSNGVSFGINGSTVTASHNGLTSQSNQAASASNGSFAFQTLGFSNANNVTFGSSAGSVITASVAAQTNQTGAIYVTANSTGQSSSSTYDARTLSMVGDGIVSAGWSNGTFRISATQSNQAFSAVGGSSAFQTLVFTNSNGVSFSNTNGSVWASVNTSYRASNDAIGLNTAATNVTWTVNSSGVSLNAAGYAGTGTSATNASITLNSAGLAISVAAPGAAAENNWHNLLGANTAGNTTASGSTIGLSGINLTLSGTNGSVLNISAPATSSLSATGQVSISTNGSTISIGVPNPATIDGYNPYADLQYGTAQYGNGTIVVDPRVFPNCQFDRLVFPIHCSNTSNSSGSHTISVNVGLYTKNASTLSLLTSYQGTVAVTHSGTQGVYSNLSGLRLLTMAVNGTITGGRYWLAVGSMTTSGGTNGSYSHLAVSAGINSALTGIFGAAATATAHWTLGQGVWSGTSNGMPSSMAFSHITGTSASIAQRPYVIGFGMGTA